MTGYTGAVRGVVDAVAGATPAIRRAFAPGDDETASADSRRTSTNPSGERQSEADVFADDLLAEQVTSVDGVGSYASEEREGVADVGDGVGVAVDPLDGSSNLASNNATGTIFGVYDADLPARGADLVAAGYVLYGPLTTMVVAADGEVTEYVVEDGERDAIRTDVTLPDDPVVYGFGGRVPNWTEAFRTYAREIESELKLRYAGAMVADVHQVVTKGGVFAYPSLSDRPEGKLRLQFEANPMAYVVETAGGRSSNGTRSLLSVEPTALHQRVPVHVGNPGLIDRLERRVGGVGA